ncbi:MAG: SRPBCC family protein [Pseudorhodoferax sp.]
MQLEQPFLLATEPARVWQAFHDVRLMVECLPGASIKPGAELVDGAEIPLLFKVKLGPIAAGFAGQGQLQLDEGTQSGSFAGGAVDAKTNSRVKGQARFALLPDAAGTRVTLAVEFAVTGSLAQFSREGIVRALAEQLTRQFADNLQARLPQAAEAPPATAAPQTAEALAAAASVACAPTVFPAPPPEPATPRAAAPAPAAAIDLWSLFKLWFRGLFVRRG